MTPNSAVSDDQVVEVRATNPETEGTIPTSKYGRRLKRTTVYYPSANLVIPSTFDMEHPIMPVALCTIGQAMKGDERGLW